MVAVTFIIALLTLTASGGMLGRARAFCILGGDHGMADLILRILMFAPLGFTRARLGMRHQ